MSASVSRGLYPLEGGVTVPELKPKPTQVLEEHVQRAGCQTTSHPQGDASLAAYLMAGWIGIASTYRIAVLGSGCIVSRSPYIATIGLGSCIVAIAIGAGRTGCSGGGRHRSSKGATGPGVVRWV
jgi:hypothetical protein